MLTAQDMRGLYAIIPTPAKPGSELIDATNTVDLDETERLVNALIRDGAAGLITLGTTGECATLSADDYRTFAACVLEVVGKRIPTFIGATALGGHEVAERLRFIKDRGADGALLGLPMWQPLNTAMAINYFGSISQAFPDLALMVYANSRAFRYDFPLDFWRGVTASAPTVMAAKYSRPRDLQAVLAATEQKIHILPNESTVANFYEKSPATTVACWATAAAMGPLPAKAMIDAILAGNTDGIDRMKAALSWANAPLKPIIGDPAIFAMYNIQAEKTRINAAGYCNCGPVRPPYDYMPAEYEEAAKECGRRWRSLCEGYLGSWQFQDGLLADMTS